LESIKKQIRGEPTSEKGDVFRESEVLSILVKYLKENGWKVKEQIRVEGGMIDVGAEKEGRILLIEAKGEDIGGYGSAEMNFQMGLGQVMSRMKHSEIQYGLAFPVTKDFTRVRQKYRGSFAFEKLGIYLVPVKRDGSCRLISPIDVLKFLDENEKVKGHSFLRLLTKKIAGSEQTMKIITSDAELQHLHSVGAGFIYNDFSGKGSSGNKYNVLHIAYCRTISGADLSAPKYFFSDIDKAIAWLRKNRGEEGKNWKRCGTCKAKAQMGRY